MPNKKNGLGISRFPNPLICNVLLLYANSLWITENRPQISLKKEAETPEGQPHGIEVWTVTQKESTGAVFP